MVNRTWLERETSSDVIWSKEQMDSLLHLYEQETELWDISNPNYSQKDARQRSNPQSSETVPSICIAEFQQQLAKYKQG